MSLGPRMNWQKQRLEEWKSVTRLLPTVQEGRGSREKEREKGKERMVGQAL